jgi:hypothetical protein
MTRGRKAYGTRGWWLRSFDAAVWLENPTCLKAAICSARELRVAAVDHCGRRRSGTVSGGDLFLRAVSTPNPVSIRSRHVLATGKRHRLAGASQPQAR